MPQAPVGTKRNKITNETVLVSEIKKQPAFTATFRTFIALQNITLKTRD
jgi:hypothetical protein